MPKPKILVIAGPTAVGKTAYAIKMARIFDGEIVSCDSMQLYKYMNIGSAKPDEEELKLAKHHLIDLIDPREEFSVARYQTLALNAIEKILSEGRLPVVSGGTGLYLNSILYDMDFAVSPKNAEYREHLENVLNEQGRDRLYSMLVEKDPEAAELIHPNNTIKVIRALERLEGGEGTVHRFSHVQTENDSFEPILVCLTRNRDELYDRINRRVDLIVSRGLVEEVSGLMKMGLTYDDISMKGIGYKEIIEYLNGDVSLNEAIESIKINTRHYAKRQLTWFRRYDRMKWFNLSEYLTDEQAVEEIAEWIRKRL